jgi:hypothetical protein
MTMEPRKEEQNQHRQDHKDDEKQRPLFKPELEKLEERIAPGGFGIGRGYGRLPWGKGW